MSGTGAANGPLIIRADASTTIGTGHVMRCLALAQAWQDAGGTVIFIMATAAAALASRLQAEGMGVTLLPGLAGSAADAIHTAALARRHEAAWVVVDGYQFGADYQRLVKEAGLRLLFIDDYGHALHYWADLVLNQNIHALEELYSSRESYTRLLLGTRYVLLRREFQLWRGWQREIPAVARKILVTLGGGDPDNVTLKVIQALSLVEVDDLEVVVVAGGANPHSQALQSAAYNSPHRIRLLTNVDQMPELMAWADLAISGSGSTCWEMAFMGLPSLTICLVDNQRPVAEQHSKSGLSVGLGSHEDISLKLIAGEMTRLQVNSELRAEMCRKGRLLVDGEGGARTIRSVQGASIKLRRVHESDCRMIWKWSNDPYVRSISFDSEPIPWEKHFEWFQERIEDPNCFFYVALMATDELPIGQLRFQVEGNEAVININIDERYRSKGHGTEILYSGCRELFKLSMVKMIHAYVKENNKASIRVFEKVGFKNMRLIIKNTHRAFHFTLEENQLK